VEQWSSVAQRVVTGLGIEAGELVLVRDAAGRPEVLTEFLLAIEQQGATPLPECVASDYLRRMLTTVPVSSLERWDQQRMRWVQQADRIISLQGNHLDPSTVPPAALASWGGAINRLTSIDEERKLPFFVVAVPTAERATSLGLSLAELEATLLPALAVESVELREAIDPVRNAISGGRTMIINTGSGCELQLTLGERPLLDDDGVIGPEDLARNAQVVMNLPGGVVYTTVIETEATGCLRLPGTGDGGPLTLRFAEGKVVEIEGGAEAESLNARFDRHSGDARRIGHVGIGLNPLLRRPLGWPLVDIQAHGQLLISFGENRYLGGQNASSLNTDFALLEASLSVDGRVIVDAGKVTV
jgi:leucyl aminopeptidase (aminopeptidase T)